MKHCYFYLSPLFAIKTYRYIAYFCLVLYSGTPTLVKAHIPTKLEPLRKSVCDFKEGEKTLY